MKTPNMKEKKSSIHYLFIHLTEQCMFTPLIYHNTPLIEPRY